MAERTKEESVKERIKKVLRTRGVPFDMPPANGYGKAGNFDFVCNVFGAYLGIEVKRDDKAGPTQLQTSHALEFANHGAVVLLIHKDNVDLVGKTVDTMSVRMLGVRINSGLCHWPDPPPMADDHDVVVKRKKP
jgi:hypothetical protein